MTRFINIYAPIVGCNFGYHLTSMVNEYSFHQNPFKTSSVINWWNPFSPCWSTKDATHLYGNCSILESSWTCKRYGLMVFATIHMWLCSIFSSWLSSERTMWMDKRWKGYIPYLKCMRMKHINRHGILWNVLCRTHNRGDTGNTLDWGWWFLCFSKLELYLVLEFHIYWETLADEELWCEASAFISRFRVHWSFPRLTGHRMYSGSQGLDWFSKPMIPMSISITLYCVCGANLFWWRGTEAQKARYLPIATGYDGERDFWDVFCQRIQLQVLHKWARLHNFMSYWRIKSLAILYPTHRSMIQFGNPRFNPKNAMVANSQDMMRHFLAMRLNPIQKVFHNHHSEDIPLFVGLQIRGYR